MLPNRLPGGCCGADGISGRVGLGGGDSGAWNSFFNGAGGSPDRPVGSKTGGTGGKTCARTGAQRRDPPQQEAETERETVKNPGPECTVLFAGEPVYCFTIHNLPPSS